MNNKNPLNEPNPARYDVAIVGCGPTGAVLANLLAECGHSVLVLEREAGIVQLPRAIRFDAECMRVFQSIGLLQRLKDQVSAAPGMKFVNAAGELLIEWQRPVELGDHGWSACYRVHQPALEQALRERLHERPGVTLLSRHDVFALTEHADYVELRYENMRNGELLTSQARYVIGCDGARSLVRRLMGSALEDLQLHERWLVIDFMLKRPMPALGDYSIQYCDPQRPSTYICGAGDRRRWEVMVMPGDDLAQINTPAWIWECLSRWIGPDDAEIERCAVYMFHSVVAQQWRRARLLIAGDAAHQTPPFMGQGMAAGIRDAANLAWKLHAVLTGGAAEALLDTYASERVPHVREFIEGAVRFGDIIQATDSEAVAARDARLSCAIDAFRTPEPALGPGAHDGLPAGLAGQVTPQFRLADGNLMDDLTGYRHLLLCRPEALALASSLVDASVICRAAEEPAMLAWLERLNACAALIRPDRYLYGVASTTNDLEPLLSRAFALPPRNHDSPRSNCA
ncbi:bifunctional 3-(3-hydroxy-phenyl)propionate/3-hydroxycinnamic acid hydroxylase [Pseudomonas sp. KU43P]|uniref:bifunctional 3-(3-hydroxy-phenyl)propionate/3-hydroxycinnamic acid hydroxylase MhpA n=1 Tax=Pseudomonas sp. KU43P TaxID=2487887 RepID=UPI0012A7D935|nr:bifunctional 3-(3-hydroxy-phenyl)propionate/3-hydroxycinnamic acid hydroxylase [Pseudomonas sp. KU43P]BBH46575.1 3-(3-hydroxyphenyl)propionate hydroxylase [Pseudomonas sp. KU43P]